MPEIQKFMERACDTFNAEIMAANEKLEDEADHANSVSVDGFVRRYLATEFYIPLMSGTFFTGLSGNTAEVKACVKRASELRTHSDTIKVLAKEYDERLKSVPSVPTVGTGDDKQSLVPHIRKPRATDEVKIISADIFG